MNVAELIRQKRDGGALAPDDIRALIAAYTDGTLPDYQAAALLMAVYFRGLDDRELDAWTLAMLHSGDVLDLSEIPGIKVDKHSTGGVGDMISIALAPLVAACGVPVPMISGRGLGHTGGTLDKLEAIPGFSVNLTIEKFRSQLATVGCALCGQTERLAPADRKLYALRDVTGTVESVPLIASSILSKKLAEGIDALVLDVKVGSGAFMKTLEQARTLAKTLVAIGRGAGKRVTAFLTDMDQPLGRRVGNAIEVQEAILTLTGMGSPDVRELTLALGAEMLVLGGVAADEAAGRAKMIGAIESGAGLAKLAEIVAAQGGDPRAILEQKLPTVATASVVVAPRAGTVAAIKADEVGLAALALGAGRLRKEDAVDPAVGLELLRKVGEPVGRGEPVVALHHRDGRGLDEARRRIERAYRISDEPAAPKATRPLVIEVMR
ncbi:MAG: thymidine phosphorylase [Myxococcales bacterium]|nr:thymidine phosphorylase [Myxococcales bacterium]